MNDTPPEIAKKMRELLSLAGSRQPACKKNWELSPEIQMERHVSTPGGTEVAWSLRCNLYNQSGLPASPFRSDTWPIAGFTK